MTILKQITDELFSFRSIAMDAAGKSWWIRAPLVVFFAYLLYRHLLDVDYFSFLYRCDLVFHEAGHFIMIPFGRTITILGGTIFQIGIPLVCCGSFLLKRDYTGVMFSVGWLGDTLFTVARYISDARERILPLIGGGSGTEGHDWYNLLGDWGLLEYDRLIGWVVRISGGVILFSAIVFGCWLLWLMYRLKGSRQPLDLDTSRFRF